MGLESDDDYRAGSFDSKGSCPLSGRTDPIVSTGIMLPSEILSQRRPEGLG
ncbi:hypothetical protein RISK_001301 [Rhodopirellula islandica]|uniref:Uncharacterized protein n=1 Tax=Rhodopirellula islandica TaxID=595434 RepID=A0A0J1BJ14_RHOIS|nr:hypothetical protein RISK_001301 [Rhodopirellula islandica]